MNTSLLFFVLACCFLVSYLNTPVAHAQVFSNESTGVRLTTNPTFPTPEAPVEVSLDDYSVDAVGATVTWYIRGIEEKAFQNERTITLQTGKLGETIPVRVVLTRSGAPALSSAITIIPSLIDIIIEADTYVPSFYRGRALPSSESSMRLIAVVHDGTQTLDTAYTYTWSENGTVLFGGPIKGKNVIELPLSRYGARDIAVAVTNAQGVSVGRKTVTVRAREPEIHFYEESPLRGLGERELSSPYPLISEEVTIYGEPFFIHGTLAGRDIEFTWNVDGEYTASDPEIPNAITLRRVGGEGEARVGLRALTTKRIPQLIEKTFNIFF